MAAPPTLDEMLVGESAASGLLSSLFVAEQQPHTVRALNIVGPNPGSGHRRAQANGGGSGAQQGNSVVVTVAVRAPTPAEARRTLQEIQVQIDSGAPIGRRLAQDDAAGRFTLRTRRRCRSKRKHERVHVHWL